MSIQQQKEALTELVDNIIGILDRIADDDAAEANLQYEEIIASLIQARVDMLMREITK